MPGGYTFLGDFKVEEQGGTIVSQSVGDKALLSGVADGTTIEVDSTTGVLQLVAQGASLAAGVQRTNVSKYQGVWFQGSITVSSATAGAFQLTNTYGSNLVVDRVLILISTATAVSGSVLTVGFGASSSADYSNLIDDLSLETAGAFDNISDHGDAGASRGLWKSGEYINATCSSSPTSLSAFYAVHVIDITA